MEHAKGDEIKHSNLIALLTLTLFITKKNISPGNDHKQKSKSAFL